MSSLGIMNNNDIELYVQQLISPATRENALLELSKKRENFPDLAPYLWYSFGTIAALLQEIVSIYPLLSPPALTAHGSNRVCNALALLQCVASHPETRGLFLQGEPPRAERLPAPHPPGCCHRAAPIFPTFCARCPVPAQRTCRCSSTPSSTPSARRGHSSTSGSQAWE
jgi:hypothetical protein